MQLCVHRLGISLALVAFAGWEFVGSHTPVAAFAQTDARPSAEDSARDAILQSDAWRRAMFEVNEWLTRQQVYTPEQVEEMRQEFSQRVAAMNAEELGQVLGDLQLKLQILDTPAAREARAWMAEYVAVLSARRRAEVLQDLPNLAELTPARLHDELVRIKQKRSHLDSRQAAFGAAQSQRVNAQVRAHQQAQSAQSRSAPRRTASFSPYRSQQSNVNDRLNQGSNNRPTFFVNEWGGISRALPQSW